jgi:hypothetical protein
VYELIPIFYDSYFFAGILTVSKFAGVKTGIPIYCLTTSAKSIILLFSPCTNITFFGSVCLINCNIPKKIKIYERTNN